MSGLLDSAAHQVRQAGKKGDLKPKTHHFFYVLVWLASVSLLVLLPPKTTEHPSADPLSLGPISGWLAPPLAVLIRFGLGRDFFINILCTICGYFPGHFHKYAPSSHTDPCVIRFPRSARLTLSPPLASPTHSFYCQTIRNNNNSARTPKWAVKYGLVKVRDKRGGKSQWATRYDERLPDSARHGYDDDEASVEAGGAAAWDGHGPEPPKKDKSRFGNGSRSDGGAKALFSPWDREVEPDEVEGGGYGPAPTSSGKAFDPIDNEEFYSSTPSPSNQSISEDSRSNRKSPSKLGSKLKPKGLKGILSHRDRYESTPAESGDRFDRMNAARGDSSSFSLGGGGGGEEEYQDEFERELNQGSRTKTTTTAAGRTGGGGGGGARYDSFESEGPEDAWASSVGRSSSTTGGGRSSVAPPSRAGSGSVAPAALVPTKTGGTVKGSREDDDLFSHTF
ncbi:hypothetical protein RQP46_004143 [Phenoliferia psychrophenolica]